MVPHGARIRKRYVFANDTSSFFILVLAEYLVLIPMGVLVAVMFMVAIGTFDWGSIRSLRTAPPGESTVMLVTVATVVYTHDLAIGVMAGIVLSALMFSRKIAHYAYMNSTLSEDGRTRTYRVYGELFFVTVTGFLAEFDYQEDVDRVIIDLSESHIWDGSAVAAIDKVVMRLRTHATHVEIVGLNEASTTILERLAIYDKPGAVLAGGH